MDHSAHRPVRLLVDPAARGSWNMAVDQALLDSVQPGSEPILRIYQWVPATVSLGYFQDSRSRESHAPSRNQPLVRRATGGGAIIHDDELTYSLVLAESDELAGRNQGLFRRVHTTLIEALRRLGVSGCEVVAEAPRETRDVPFLCFLRRSPGDVVMGEAKIIGSAQRRRRGALLQHGSVLLGRSRFAPELPGINDQVVVARITVESLAESWRQVLGEEFGWQINAGVTEDGEVQLARNIEQTRFATVAWTEKSRGGIGPKKP